jgi:hypothetical protein
MHELMDSSCSKKINNQHDCFSKEDEFGLWASPFVISRGYKRKLCFYFG